MYFKEINNNNKTMASFMPFVFQKYVIYFFLFFRNFRRFKKKYLLSFAASEKIVDDHFNKKILLLKRTISKMLYYLTTVNFTEIKGLLKEIFRISGYRKLKAPLIHFIWKIMFENGNFFVTFNFLKMEKAIMPHTS